MIRAALLALALALPGMAQAQSGTPLDALDRRDEMLSWEGVGRLDTPRGFCTGTLIAADVVLTAAHCVSGLRSMRGVTFRAGYYRGRAIAERGVQQAAIPAAYPKDRDGRLTSESVRSDVALLKLSTPITSAQADPFRVGTAPPSSDLVSVLSYGRGRAETLSRQAECSVTERYADGILGFDCDVTFGSSGAPVFFRENGRLRIVSLVSGGGEGVAYGMTLPDTVSALMRELRNESARPLVSQGARRLSVGSGQRASGSKFLRP